MNADKIIILHVLLFLIFVVEGIRRDKNELRNRHFHRNQKREGPTRIQIHLPASASQALSAQDLQLAIEANEALRKAEENFNKQQTQDINKQQLQKPETQGQESLNRPEGQGNLNKQEIVPKQESLNKPEIQGQGNLNKQEKLSKQESLNKQEMAQAQENAMKQQMQRHLQNPEPNVPMTLLNPMKPLEANLSNLDALKQSIDKSKYLMMENPSPQTIKHEEEESSENDLSVTLTQALPLLEKISQEIHEKKDEEEEKPQSKNDFPCSINGLWISNIGGMKINLTVHMDGKVGVTTSATDDHRTGVLHDCAWHLSGLVPSLRQGPFALAAVCSPQHRIASFIGQCRVCGDIDTIFGNWMFSRISRDCSEAMSAMDMRPDIWRKDRIPEMKERKLHQMAKHHKKNHKCKEEPCPNR